MDPRLEEDGHGEEGGRKVARPQAGRHDHPVGRYVC